jgi:hypothetical protein
LYNTNGIRGNFVTNSLNIGLYTTDGEYSNQTVFNRTSSEILSGSTGKNDVTCSFVALPGAEYYITANQYGNLIYAFRFDGAGSGFSTRTGACNASTGGPTYYSFWNSPSANNTVIYTNIGMSSVLAGGSLWFPATNVDGSSRLPLLINNSGLVTDFQGPC